MLRFGVYMVGLLLVVAAVWVLLTGTGLLEFLPATIVAVVLLAVLGLGVMAASRTIDEGPVEVKETRQKVGDTEVRRSKVE